MYNHYLPLKSIFTKSIVESPPRIQKFLLRLQKYNFGMAYMQGSLLTVADTLSAFIHSSTPHETNIFQIWYSQRSCIRQRSRIHRECLQKI